MQQNKHLDDLRSWAAGVAEGRKVDAKVFAPEFGYAALATRTEEAEAIACAVLKGILSDYFRRGEGPIFWRHEPTLSIQTVSLNGDEYVMAKAYARCWRGFSGDVSNTRGMAALAQVIGSQKEAA